MRQKKKKKKKNTSALIHKYNKSVSYLFFFFNLKNINFVVIVVTFLLQITIEICKTEILVLQNQRKPTKIAID